MNKTEKAYDVLLSLILIIPVTLFSAYTTMTLWNWFIADTFNLIKLSMWQAYGIDIVVSYLTYKKSPSNKEDTPYKTTFGMIEAAMITFTFLVIGLIVKQFI